MPRWEFLPCLALARAHQTLSELLVIKPSPTIWIPRVGTGKATYLPLWQFSKKPIFLCLLWLRHPQNPAYLFLRSHRRLRATSAFPVFTHFSQYRAEKFPPGTSIWNLGF